MKVLNYENHVCTWNSLTEKARIEAQIKAAEVAFSLRAQEELRIRRERERDAARIALQKV